MEMAISRVDEAKDAARSKSSTRCHVDLQRGQQQAVDTAPVESASALPDASAIKNLMTPEQVDLGGPVVNSIDIVLVPIPGR